MRTGGSVEISLFIGCDSQRNIMGRCLVACLTRGYRFTLVPYPCWCAVLPFHCLDDAPQHAGEYHGVQRIHGIPVEEAKEAHRVKYGGLAYGRPRGLTVDLKFQPRASRHLHLGGQS